MSTIYLLIVLFPLLGAIVAGLYGKTIGRSAAHWVTCIGVGFSCLLSMYVLYQHAFNGMAPYNETVYTWAVIGGLNMEVGFLVDRLSAMMMVVVTFVSLMVHVYTIGYMAHDEGYQRFFSYISLFTFSMLMLVMSNNLLQLFFGWEAVGLVSYLLIGFYHKKPSAIHANMKAFLVNRVGDFGFILGIAAALYAFNTLDYAEIFAALQTGAHAVEAHGVGHGGAAAAHGEAVVATVDPAIVSATIPGLLGGEWSLVTTMCILLFIGAMGKSAQVPLHVWLPDSMEGPTPISALIHAATMVTAGIFMVARLSPLFELSETALSFILIIGSITALFMGLLGIIQNDIKRVVAYSTLSQLGYMTVALGASAYSAAIFHLMTHAFFKALLFLAAGSVIIGMHHVQDIRKMGNLRQYMPITWACFLLGSLALMGLPGTSGYYSKDMIIEAVYASQITGSSFAYLAVLIGVFITAFYSVRLYLVVFHGEERMDEHEKAHLHESPRVVTVPLILLAIPSVLIGMFTVEHMVLGGYFSDSIHVRHEHDVLHHARDHFYGPIYFAFHAIITLPFWMMIAGTASAWYLYVKRPELPGRIRERLAPVYGFMERKYGFDDFNQAVFARGSVGLGKGLWKYADAGLIDGILVNGSARVIGWVASIARYLQSGYLYHYAFAMIIGLMIMLSFIVLR